MKITGMIMIIIFTTSIGLAIAGKKKSQLIYIDNVIYICEILSLMLKSTMPETDVIINRLKSDDRLSDFDFESKNSPLKVEDKNRVRSLLDSVGKYDVDSQLKIIDEASGYFKILKEEYRSYYNKHYKLYIMFGMFSGIVISVLIA